MINSIELLDLEGRKVDLMVEYKGKAMVLVFYNNSCLGCTGRAIPLAYEFQQDNKTLQVVGVHSNFGKMQVTKEDIQSIFTTGEVPFPIYIDENHVVFDQFESEGTPQWVLINAQGELYRSFFGSQDGAQNRLLYAIEELVVEEA